MVKCFTKIENVDAAIHLAAASRPNSTWDEILRNNIIGTRNVFECAKQFNIGKVIFASSIHVAWEQIEKMVNTKPVFPIK